MKFRKTIAQILSMVMLISTFAFLGGTKLSDEQTLLAEQIGYELLNAEKTEEQYKQEVYSYDLKGLDGQEDFILIMGQDSGYAIFAKENLNLIEYSPYGNSPYEDLDKSQARYAGPASYFVKNDLGVKNLITNEVVEEARLSDIAEQVRAVAKIGKVETPIEKPIVKEEIALQSVEIENVKVSGYENNSSNSYNSNTGDFEHEYVYEYDALNKTLISDYNYFLCKPDLPTNTGSTCATIAAQLLLSYNKWSKYGNLITNSDFLPKFTQDIAYEKTPYYTKNISTTVAFYEYLIDVIDKAQDGATIFDVYGGIIAYLKDYFTVTEINNLFEVNCSINLANVNNIIKEEIDANRPLIVYIKNKANEKHVVVVYGYQKFIINHEAVQGYIAHFGWENEQGMNYRWFNAQWLTGDYLTFKVNHVHEDVFITKDGGQPDNHIMQCATCYRLATTNNHILDSYETLAIYSGIENNDTAEEIVENRVESPDFHLSICDCGYKVEVRHQFKYTDNFDGKTHSQRCVQCRYVKSKGDHKFKYHIKENCLYCGGDGIDG